jgi:hypothetical protein
MKSSSFKTKAGNAAFGIALVFGAAAFGTVIIGVPAAKMGINPIMTDYNGAVQTVEKAGFKDAKATGYGWFACGIGESADLWRTKFTATNQNGQTVDGVVCSSILKAGTIRFN